jgi:hypothetical protein
MLSSSRKYGEIGTYRLHHQGDESLIALMVEAVSKHL